MGWKLHCSCGVFACISALISLDLFTKPADNRLEMQANPLEIATLRL
jgi:hypothetical protein